MHAIRSPVCPSSETVCMFRMGKPTEVAAQSAPANTPATARAMRANGKDIDNVAKVNAGSEREMQ